MIFGFIRLDFQLVPINNTLYYCFWKTLYIIKNLIILFYLFCSLSFNFSTGLRSRVTSIWYKSLTLIRDQISDDVKFDPSTFDPISSLEFDNNEVPRPIFSILLRFDLKLNWV